MSLFTITTHSNTLITCGTTSTSTSTSTSSWFLGTFILSLPSIIRGQNSFKSRCCCAVKTGSNDSFRPDLLKKPVISPSPDNNDNDNDIDNDSDDEKKFERVDDKINGEKWVDWEDQILQDTVPLVGFVRMILHSGKYQSGDRLAAEHEKTILDRLLPFHPECDKKIGCGVDYVTIGYHPQFQDSRCLFIVRKDGEVVDFSYWKCIKGFIRKNYPLYADSFIFKHFRRRRR